MVLGYFLSSFGFLCTEFSALKDRVPRKVLHRLLSDRVSGFPVRPLPHGKVVAHLWDFLPEDCRCDPRCIDDWWGLLRDNDWFVVPESPKERTLFLGVGSVAEGATIPPIDVYFVPVDHTKDILAVDHEGVGPWRVPGSWQGHRSERIEWERRFRVPLVKASSAPSIVSEVPSSPQWRYLRSRLRRKGIYIPNYRLTSSGPFADHLWNYIPTLFDSEIAEGSFAFELMLECPAVMMLREDKGNAVIVDSPKTPSELLIPNSYWMEYPGRRWLLTVPEEFVQAPNDSSVEPSFIVF